MDLLHIYNWGGHRISNCKGMYKNISRKGHDSKPWWGSPRKFSAQDLSRTRFRDCINKAYLSHLLVWSNLEKKWKPMKSIIFPLFDSRNKTLGIKHNECNSIWYLRSHEFNDISLLQGTPLCPNNICKRHFPGIFIGQPINKRIQYIYIYI